METKEELMKKVGSFGFFQKRTLCVAYLMSLLAGPTIMLCNVFSVYTPTHRCYIPDIDDNPNRTEQHEALPEVPQEYVYMQVNKSVVVLSNEIYGNGSGADLC